MSTETLRKAFKHGAKARLYQTVPHCSYDDPAHAAEWLKGWRNCDANQRAYATAQEAKKKREARRMVLPDLTDIKCPVMFYSTPCSKSNDYIKQIWDNLRDPFELPAPGPRLTGVWYEETVTYPTKETSAMNSTLAYIFASMLPEVTGIIVKFDDGRGGKPYTYKALKNQNLKTGDIVMVNSPYTGLTAVEVQALVTFDDLDPGAYKGYKWISGTVSMADYTEVMAKEAAFVEKVAELQRKAKREAAVKALAEQIGGMDALTAIMAELAGAEAAPSPAPAPAMDQPAPAAE